jgi:indole-3-glycerol phosphate synthase
MGFIPWLVTEQSPNHTTRKAPEGQVSVTLDQILASASARAEALRPHRAALARAAASAPAPPAFQAALRRPDVAVIAEIKRRSPSAGSINPTLDPVQLAGTYAAHGAAAISVLTDQPYFGGSLSDLVNVARAVSLPALRKDFILVEEQLLETRAAGAAAALLIVRALEQRRLSALIQFASTIGLGTLVETHDADEILRAVDAGANIIGVNSRDLDTFVVDVPRALALLQRIPRSVVAVAESGVAHRVQVTAAAGAGADAVLVGGALSGAPDPAQLLSTLAGVTRCGR